MLKSGANQTWRLKAVVPSQAHRLEPGITAVGCREFVESGGVSAISARRLTALLVGTCCLYSAIQSAYALHVSSHLLIVRLYRSYHCVRAPLEQTADYFGRFRFGSHDGGLAQALQKLLETTALTHGFEGIIGSCISLSGVCCSQPVQSDGLK
jgi:hypothetical protein